MKAEPLSVTAIEYWTKGKEHVRIKTSSFDLLLSNRNCGGNSQRTEEEVFPRERIILGEGKWKLVNITSE